MKLRKLLGPMIVGLLIGAPTASAQSPYANAYGGEANLPAQLAGTNPAKAGVLPVNSGGVPGPDLAAVAAASDARNAPASEVRALSAGSLPFTGMDLLLVGIGGAVLLMLGLGLRRLTAQPRAVI